MGGVNIISIWGWRKIHDERKLQKKTNKIEKWVRSSLEERKGKAFSAELIHQQCNEELQLELSLKKIERVLYDMQSSGKVRFRVEENKRYYSAP